MQVDFYQLSRDPVERVVPLLAGKVLDGGGRLLVVSAEEAHRTALSQALWEREGTFLAHGQAGVPHAARQPVLLASDCDAANGATIVLMADGVWRDQATGFARAILLFDAARTEEARRLWPALGGQGHELRIFKQRDGGGWREGA